MHEGIEEVMAAVEKRSQDDYSGKGWSGRFENMLVVERMNLETPQMDDLLEEMGN